MDTNKKNRCCICGTLMYGYGHNAEPIDHGRCCDRCNVEVVIPRRIEFLNTIKEGEV